MTYAFTISSITLWVVLILAISGYGMEALLWAWAIGVIFGGVLMGLAEVGWSWVDKNDK